MFDFKFAALFAGAAAVWNQIKAVLASFWSIFFVSVKFRDNDLVRAMRFYVTNSPNKIGFGDHTYRAEFMIIHRLRKSKIVLFQLPQQYTVLFFGWVPVLYREVQDKNNGSGLGFTFIRGTFNAEKFLIDVINNYESKCLEPSNGTRSRYRISQVVGSASGNFMTALLKNADKTKGEPLDSDENDSDEAMFDRIVNYTQDDLLKPIKHPFRWYPFPKHVKEHIDELKYWKDAKEWFFDRGLQWRMGWGLYGPPGTGKSTLIRALGQDINVPVFIFHLATLSDKEFLDEWSRMLRHTPCIAAFEDIDTVFNGRKNITNSKGLSFTTLLNCISGVQEANGVISIVTTNRVEHIDEALGVLDENGKVTRPGRLDRIIFLKEMIDEERRELALNILGEWPEQIDKLVTDGQGETAAQFSDRCATLALKLWKQKIEDSKIIKAA